MLNIFVLFIMFSFLAQRASSMLLYALVHSVVCLSYVLRLIDLMHVLLLTCKFSDVFVMFFV